MISFIFRVLSWAFTLLASLVLFFVLFWLLIAGVIFSLSPKPDVIEDRTALVIDLNFVVTDTPRSPEFSQLILEVASQSAAPARYSLREVTQTLQAARQDPRITSVLLTGNLAADSYGSSLASLREIREILASFADVDKPVIAYLNGDGIRDLYLKSTASHLYMNPMADQVFNGLSISALFMGDALRHLGIDLTVFQGGKYKTAYDFLTRSEMSSDDRDQLQDLIDDLWQTVVRDIANSRNISEMELANWSASQPILNAKAALAAGLVDKIMYSDELITEMREFSDRSGNGEGFRRVAFRSYLNQEMQKSAKSAIAAADKVAVIYIEGQLVSRGQGEGMVEGARIAARLRAARQDPSVKAVVLRVNSPGGGISPSEDILREVQLTNARKPVVVSMGGMAASGGYWLSAMSEKIVVEASTITGSIGVVGMHFNIDELSEKLNLNFETVRVHDKADFLNTTRALTEDEKEWYSDRIDGYYREFIDRVAVGRQMEWNRVHDLAQGRVWTGKQAVELGLADHLGGLEDSIQLSADLAGITRYEVTEYPKRSEIFHMLELMMHSESARAWFSKTSTVSANPITRHLKQQWRQLEAVSNSPEAQALMPFTFILE
jgi:protease-4